MIESEYDIKIPNDVTSCVYRLWYNSKYLVLKTKTLYWSVEKIKKGLHYFLKHTEHSHDPKSLGYKLYNYVEDYPGNNFSIEVILQSDSAYELLRREQQELDKSKQDTNCLNVKFDAYAPRYMQSNKKDKPQTWIKRGTYLNFLRWKKTRHLNNG